MERGVSSCDRGEGSMGKERTDAWAAVLDGGGWCGIVN